MNDTLKYVDYSHMGYTLRQFLNIWHYQIIDDASGKTVLCCNCSKKLTQDEAIHTIDEYIERQGKPKEVYKVCLMCNK